jgi:hypothetical protein
MDNPRATRDDGDFDTLPLPARHARVPWHRAFTPEESKRIAAGAIPEVMEDKWHIFLEGDRLCFHRSWTGVCYFEARLVEQANAYHIVEVFVNRDPEQVGFIDENDDGTAVINRLLDRVIDGVLLGRYQMLNPVIDLVLIGRTRMASEQG